MRLLCGYCQAYPAVERGYCHLCLFSFKQAGITTTGIPPVKWYPAPPLVEVNARLAAWLQEQAQ